MSTSIFRADSDTPPSSIFINHSAIGTVTKRVAVFSKKMHPRHGLSP
jgi:hypothetical protein